MTKRVGDRVVLKPAACLLLSLANRRNTRQAHVNKRTLFRRHGKVVGIIRERGKTYITVRWWGVTREWEKELTYPASYLTHHPAFRRSKTSGQETSPRQAG